MLVLAVPSRTREGVTYSVAVADAGATCDCPGFYFHRHCYHSEAFLAFARALADGPKKRRAA